MNKFLPLLFSFLFPAPIFADWTVGKSKDEMSGAVSYYASSSLISASDEMHFPYKGTKSVANVACNSEGEIWSYFYFTKKPNISGDQTENGYSRSKSRFKVDNDLRSLSLTQEWGSQYMHVVSEDSFIDAVRKSSQMYLELNWHGQGNVIFKYSNKGSSKAISQAFEKCGLSHILAKRDEQKRKEMIVKKKVLLEEEKIRRKYEKIEQQGSLPRYSDLPKEEQRRLQLMFEKEMTPQELTIWKTR